MVQTVKILNQELNALNGLKVVATELNALNSNAVKIYAPLMFYMKVNPSLVNTLFKKLIWVGGNSDARGLIGYIAKNHT